MEMYDNQHHVLKYFVKPITTGKILLAHVDCLKTDSTDYVKLSVAKAEKILGQAVEEVHENVDAKFDYGKVQAKFLELRIMEPHEFDTAVLLNQKEGFLNADLTPTPEGVAKIEEIQAAHEASPEYIKMITKNSNLDVRPIEEVPIGETIVKK